MTEAVIEIEKLRFRWAVDSDFCLDIPAFTARAGERVFPVSYTHLTLPTSDLV